MTEFKTKSDHLSRNISKTCGVGLQRKISSEPKRSRMSSRPTDEHVSHGRIFDKALRRLKCETNSTTSRHKSNKRYSSGNRGSKMYTKRQN